ncbi:MAG: response regulator transcription factor [Gammaproteobacteria bacterium]|nr:response regulator transcription factor [Gammaproteobacteria bacterium]
MKIIVFSKQSHTLEQLQEKISNIANVEEVPVCNSFHDIDIEVKKPHDILVYHLSPDEQEEKVLYQFLDLYQQSNKVFVVSNIPTAEQGKRILSAGVLAYTNTYISPEKLTLALNAISQGKIWMGDEIARVFKELGVNADEAAASVSQNTESEQEQVKDDEAQVESSPEPTEQTISEPKPSQGIFSKIKSFFS